MGCLLILKPLWNKAAQEVLLQYGVKLSAQQYITTTGLRTKDLLNGGSAILSCRLKKW